MVQSIGAGYLAELGQMGMGMGMGMGGGSGAAGPRKGRATEHTYTCSLEELHNMILNWDSLSLTFIFIAIVRRVTSEPADLTMTGSSTESGSF
jgi:hypothetical protein